MALVSYQLVLAAGAQRASNVYGGASANNAINPMQDIPYRQVIITATGGAAFVGGDNLTTSTLYGYQILTTDPFGLLLGPFSEGPLKLSDIWLAGAGATVRILGVPF